MVKHKQAIIFCLVVAPCNYHLKTALASTERRLAALYFPHSPAVCVLSAFHRCD